MVEDEIRFAVADGIGQITLNRPKALNALTLDQFQRMLPLLDQWAGDPAVSAVLIEAVGGKAFSAGGDIRSLYEQRQRGEFEALYDFYRTEYRVNRRIKTFPKPYIALIDGIVMGGGVGVSIHGSHRVVTDKTMFAMPETGIGLFPDVGGTFFLSRCPHHIGIYLGLTGARIGAADCLFAGLATDYVPSDRLPELVEGLRSLHLHGTDAQAAVGIILDSYEEDPGPAPLAEHAEVIERCFGHATVEEIMAALEAEDSDWARQTLAVMAKKSPLSQKIALKQIRVGAHLDFDRCMNLEFRLACRFMHGHDFFEGTRAVVIDKDQSPKWQPATLAEVTDEQVDAYFRPLAPDQELHFE